MYHCHLLHHEDDGMMGSFIVLDTTTSGISKNENQNALTLFPNPVTDLIQLKVGTGYPSAEVEVFNPLGVLVRRKFFSGGEQLKLDASGLAPGVYMLRLNSGSRIFSARFLNQ
jgi:hypothetical protein